MEETGVEILRYLLLKSQNFCYRNKTKGLIHREPNLEIKGEDIRENEPNTKVDKYRLINSLIYHHMCHATYFHCYYSKS